MIAVLQQVRKVLEQVRNYHSQKHSYIIDLILIREIWQMYGQWYHTWSHWLTWFVLPFLKCEAHIRHYTLRVEVPFCILFFSMLFWRVVLLLIQSTRWQQNAFKYLLDCHCSLYPCITTWLCSHSQNSVLLLHSCIPVWWSCSPPAL